MRPPFAMLSHPARPEHHLGVGLRSKRERAAELGGTLIVEPGAAGGTLVRAPAAESVSEQ